MGVLTPLMLTCVDAALSVAVRNAPPRMKSMLDLRMASRSASASTPLPRLQGAKKCPSELQTPSSPRGEGAETFSPRSNLSRRNMSLQRSGGQTEGEEDGRSTGSKPLVLMPCPDLWDGAEHEGRLVNCAPRKGSEGAVLPDLLSTVPPRGQRTSSGLMLQEGSAAVSWGTDSVMPPSVPPTLFESAEGTASVTKSGAQALEEMQTSAQNVDTQDCQWHEVFVTTVVDEDDGRWDDACAV